MAVRFGILVTLVTFVHFAKAGVVTPYATTYNAHSIQHAVAYPVQPAVVASPPINVATPPKVSFTTPAFAPAASPVVVNAPSKVNFSTAPIVPSKVPIGFPNSAFSSPVSFASPAFSNNIGLTGPNYSLTPSSLAFNSPGKVTFAAPVYNGHSAFAAPTYPVASGSISQPNKVSFTTNGLPTPRFSETLAAHNSPYYF